MVSENKKHLKNHWKIQMETHWIILSKEKFQQKGIDITLSIVQLLLGMDKKNHWNIN